MNRHVFRIAATVATLAAGTAAAQNYPNAQGYGYGNDGRQQGQIVRCESTQSRSNLCRIDTRGQVRLVRQLSRTRCVQGRNWATSRDGIRVTGGCRADFQVYNDDRYGNGRYHDRDRNNDGAYDDQRYRGRVGQAVHCVPRNYERTYCGDAQARFVTNPFRNPSCIEGRNWGRDQRGIWVSGNCNMQFTRTSYDDDRGYRGYRDDRDDRDDHDDRYGNRDDDYRYDPLRSAQVIDCQSTSSGRTYCGDRESRYVLTGMHDGECRQGETYGRDENGTWVSGNCDAQLRVQAVENY